MNALFGNFASLLKKLESFPANHVVVVKKSLRFLDPGTHRLVETGPFHTDRIDGTDPCGVAFGDQEWRRVSTDFGHASDKGQATHGGIVVNRRQSPKTSLIFDDHVTAEQHTIGHDDFVTDDAVMGDMGTGQNVTAVAHAGNPATLNGSAVNGAVFPKKIVGPYFEPGLFPLPLFILGVSSDDGAGMNDIAGTDAGVLDDGGMMMNLAVVADGYLGTDIGPGPDFHALTQFCTGVDYRRWVYQSKLPIEHPPA